MKALGAIFFIISLHCTDYVHLYTLYTESHRPLIENWFLPSIKNHEKNVIVHIHYFPQECPTGRYMESGWKKTTMKKVEIIIEAIKRHKGSWFIYSDVDIQFFEAIGDEIRLMLNDYDLVIQQDNPKGSVCSGFFGCRANDATQKLWEQVLLNMQQTNHSDQGALNDVLHHSKDLNITWRLLPETYFGGGLLTGKQWQPNLLLRIPDGIKIHHANWTVDIPNKIAQLALVRRIVKHRKKFTHGFAVD